MHVLHIRKADTDFLNPPNTLCINKAPLNVALVPFADTTMPLDDKIEIPNERLKYTIFFNILQIRTTLMAHSLERSFGCTLPRKNNSNLTFFHISAKRIHNFKFTIISNDLQCSSITCEESMLVENRSITKIFQLTVTTDSTQAIFNFFI